MKAGNYDMQIKCILMHANLLRFNFNVCRLKQILVISICNTIPFCPFLLFTALSFPCSLQIEITIMSKMHQIIVVTWFSRNSAEFFSSIFSAYTVATTMFKNSQRSKKLNNI